MAELGLIWFGWLVVGRVVVAGVGGGGVVGGGGEGC